MTVFFLLFVVLKQILLLELWKIPNTISFSKHCKSNFAWSHKPAVKVCECTHACMCVCVHAQMYFSLFPRKLFLSMELLGVEDEYEEDFLIRLFSFTCMFLSFTTLVWNIEVFDTPHLNLFFIGKHLTVTQAQHKWQHSWHFCNGYPYVLFTVTCWVWLLTWTGSWSLLLYAPAFPWCLNPPLEESCMLQLSRYCHWIILQLMKHTYLGFLHCLFLSDDCSLLSFSDCWICFCNIHEHWA